MPKDQDKLQKYTSQTGKKTVYRDSVSGEFVKKSYSERNPRTTEKERVRTGPPKKGK